MNRVDYLERAKSLLRDNFRPNDPDGSMTAASAAYRLKRLLGNFEDVGFFKFKDLLQTLQDENFLVTGPNSKQAFSFKLLGNAKGPNRTQAPLGQRRLKADVWYAFVKADPPGKRYFDSLSGEIRVNCETPPGNGWIELTPVSPSWEKQNASAFLDRNDVTSQKARQAIEEPKWYLAFSEALHGVSPQLASDWKRERSHSVIDVVEKWCKDNGIDTSQIYEATSQIQKRTFTQFKPVPPSLGQDILREALLNAISHLTTAELLEIRIPASKLIGELRPDLLQ